MFSRLKAWTCAHFCWTHSSQKTFLPSRGAGDLLVFEWTTVSIGSPAAMANRIRQEKTDSFITCNQLLAPDHQIIFIEKVAWSIFILTFITNAPMWILHRCGFCTDVDFAPMWILYLKCRHLEGRGWPEKYANRLLRWPHFYWLHVFSWIHWYLIHSYQFCGLTQIE